ncbi:MAG: transketolase C-terminal domain-containing protein, partial [Gammaproteobacteria bacterium]
GKAELRRKGAGVAILAFGVMAPECDPVAEELGATLVNMRFVKPLDENLVVEAAAEHECLVTVEDNVVAGGAGSAVSECLAKHGVLVPVFHLGLPDRLIQHGSREDMLADAGLNKESILAFIAHCRASQQRACRAVQSA